MLVCHCLAISDRRISQVLAAGANGLAGVVRATRAGTGCGSCLPALRRACEASARADEDSQLAAHACEESLAG